MDPFRLLRLIWFALMLGVVGYTVAAFGLVTSGALAFDLLDGPIVDMIAVALLIYMCSGLLLRRVMVARLPDGDSDARLMRYRTATILGLALMESGGLLVITLGMLSSKPAWVLAGGASAVAMMLMARPSAREAGFDREL